jgi:hypothetical protein
MLQISKEKIATYIGSKFGDDLAQEWTSKKQITLKEALQEGQSHQEPYYSQGHQPKV